MERISIYQGERISLDKCGSQFRLDLTRNCWVASKAGKKVVTTYSEKNMITQLDKLKGIHPMLDDELSAAKDRLMTYYMYGDPDSEFDEPDDIDPAFQYDDSTWNTDQSDSQDELDPDEASQRLAAIVEHKPKCYAQHDGDNRRSRCLICEHEMECKAATAKLLAAKKSNKSTETRKENKFMKQMENLFKEFYPSEVPSGEVALTMGGQLAVSRKDGSYVRYNAATGQIENQMNLVISSSKLDKMYILMPTQIAQLQAGDIIKEKDTYYQVIAIDAAKNRIKAANLSTGTESNIKIETNIFTGQKMYRKVFSFFNMIQNQQGTANPMMGGAAGMMNPMALMMLDSFGDSGDDAMKAMAMMSMMNPQAGQGMMNPMMMYFMMGDSKDGDGNDWIKMMAMGSMMQQMGGAMNPFNGMMGNQQVPGQMDMDQFKQDNATPQDATDEDWDEK